MKFAWSRLPLLALLGVSAAAAQPVCPGYSVCPTVNPKVVLAQPLAQAVLANIDATEAQAVQNANANGINFNQLLAFLGQAIANDRTLSVNRTEACTLCHRDATGFAGGIPAFTRVGGAFPGALPHRTGPRNPQPLAYAAFSPVLAYRAQTQDFAGGNFWDSRATGLLTGAAGADQATVPLTTPFEEALPDPACAVRRLLAGNYAALFVKVWGSQAPNITWPANTDRVCARPNDGGPNQTPLALTQNDRAIAALAVTQIGLTVYAFESSNLSSRFTSKYDAVLAGTAQFTRAENLGYTLFNGRAHCSACHSTTGTHPLLTDFTSDNNGVPRNPALPFENENVPDYRGFVANPAGPAYVDEGLGGFLASPANTNQQWQAQAARFMGAFQVPTLRNVVETPARGFPRAYMHNGYFRDLRTLVHFYNTRDVLPRCTGIEGAGVTCWPAPEEPRNVNTTLMGNLGLSHLEEGAVIAFLATLTDGYTP
jgi:cytochrome c peroxidase